MTTSVTTCPSCGSTRLRPHCDHVDRCRWVVCRRCSSFGIPREKWYDRKTGRAP